VDGEGGTKEGKKKDLRRDEKMGVRPPLPGGGRLEAQKKDEGGLH